jgi:hypothetical protein
MKHTNEINKNIVVYVATNDMQPGKSPLPKTNLSPREEKHI